MLALTNKKVITQPLDSYRFILAGNTEVLSLAKVESNLHIINTKNFVLSKLMLDPKWAYTCWLISLFLYRTLELNLLKNQPKFFKTLIFYGLPKRNQIYISILYVFYVKTIIY